MNRSDARDVTLAAAAPTYIRPRRGAEMRQALVEEQALPLGFDA
jgi:hypothetical protein